MDKYTVIWKDDRVILDPKKYVNTLIWIHGLGESLQLNLERVTSIFSDQLHNTRVVIPQAPKRWVTVLGCEVSSWFDILFRSQKSFDVPFNQAFSQQQVLNSFEKVLKPLIEAESELLHQVSPLGKLVVGGFSQGCGMSLHCLYQMPQKVDAALGVAGYLFPFTKFSKEVPNRKQIIFGLNDQVRPWNAVKKTYDAKIGQDQIVLVQGMQHSTDHPQTHHHMRMFLNSLLGSKL